jgi:iron complex outermembrane receptor protein
MSAFPFSRTRLALALALPLGATLATPAFAQTPPSPAASSPSSTVLAPVTVTGNPLRSNEIAAPVSVLSGDELTLRRGSSLGETLASQPGVSSTWFGPNANRPVIRGLDGDRVRILSNAGGSVDASSLSFDHAVPIDPLIVERIEVLRGPGALLYGGSAVGGVVNTIDNRIPDEKIEAPGGAAEARLGGADRERGGAVLVETGNGRFALHADAFGRETSDLRVPRFTPIEDGTALDPTTRVRNSAARASGGAVGGSWTFGTGYLGLSADTYDGRYGVVVEPDVTIRMQRDHVGLAGEWRELGGPIRTVRTQLNRTRYEHKEIEGSGEVGTTFDSTGTEARIEAEHAPIGSVRGVVGLQLESTDFSALGEEAFVPSTTTRRQGLFMLEESPWPFGTLSAGLRLERDRIGSAGDADPAEAQFGPAQERRFSLSSASLSNVLKLSSNWSVAATLSRTERAPTFYELFANGVHVATGAFERGDPTLGSERGSNLDLALQWRQGNDKLRLGVFAARFSRYISLEASGATVDVPNEDGGTDSVAEYLFRAVRAQLHGVEIEGKRRLLASPWTLDLSAKLDATRARNSDTGEALPRVAPLRVTLGLEAGLGAWTARAELEHAARQDRVPATDVPTDGYTLLGLALTRRFTLGESEGLWFVKLSNVGNELAYSASSIQSVRELAPMPARALKTGVRVTF